MTVHRTAESGVSRAAVEQRAGAPARAGGKWWTLVAVCLGMFMLLLDITIVTVALPDIQRGLGSGFADLQWIVDAYALTLAAFLLTAGSLSDSYGRRRLFLIGLVVFTGASLLCGFATSTLMLQVSRAVQGVGGAIMFAVSLALLADAFRGKDRGVAFGIWGAITGIAVAVGPLLGGVLTSGISWRWIFFVNAPVGAVAIVITVLKVAESRQAGAARPDSPGFVLFSLGLASLVYGLIESNQKSLGNGLVVGSFVAAGLLLAAFVLAEFRARHPMFDLTLFRRPAFSGGCVAAFGLSASIFAMILYLVLYLQDILGYSALGTGLRLTVLSAGMFAAATIPGRASAHVPARLLIGAGLIGGGLGLLLMRGLGAASSWTHLIPGLILAGVGAGLVNPAARLDRRERGAARTGRHGLWDQLHVPSGGHRHRHRRAGHLVLAHGDRPGAGHHHHRPRHVRVGRPGHRRGAVRPDRQAHRAPACPHRAGRRDGHQIGLHRRAQRDPARGGHHRVRIRARACPGIRSLPAGPIWWTSA